ncbi:hemerythrin domain-containing protein [Allorhizocola rhizosphaerae]|uniref:hemerythrin domain-containing protein n=1 Tax=Allorhizocola rhizosphaerae TaxID=1872709 RepID=UPI000E3E669B|nr:hemerythrin domain-containing protein [Allorhizocola rhizosphaerae]
MTSSTEQQDVVELLLQQHQQIKDMFARLERAGGAERERLFHYLVRFLAVHESAEEMVVHPAARDSDERVVQQRLGEENEAKHALAKLYDMGVDHPQFATRLSMVGASVIQHAEREEAEEFPLLLRDNSPEKLQRMAAMVRAAEATAPTRPHPGAGESAMANILAGPPLAVFDRIRDAIRDAIRDGGSAST